MPFDPLTDSVAPRSERHPTRPVVFDRRALHSDARRLSYTMTVSDPATFSAPIELKRSWVWQSGETVKPYDCVKCKAGR